MAGSYEHCIDDGGRLIKPSTGWIGFVENGGDAVETIEKMYGMIWFLAGGDALRVRNASLRYREGLEYSPGMVDEYGQHVGAW
jgi:hypothetical protein